MTNIFVLCMDTGKVNSKGRKVFVSSRGATYALESGKKVYVKKLLTPRPSKPVPAPEPVPEPTPKTPIGSVNSGKVNSKGRKVFVSSRGATYAVEGGKKVYVKKLLTPRPSKPAPVPKPAPEPAPEPAPKTPIGNVSSGKVNSKGRKVFVSSRGATYALEGGKKVYVKKLLTPRPSNPSPKPNGDINSGKVNSKGRKVFVTSRGYKYVVKDGKKIPVMKTYTPPPPPSIETSKRPLQASCPSSGLYQLSGTCWFNAPLNGIVLASRTQTMLVKYINNLNEADFAAIRDMKIDEVCPRELSKKYILAYAYMIYSNRVQKKNQNTSLNLVGKMFTPGRLPNAVLAGSGHVPMVAIKQILERVFPYKDYVEVHSSPVGMSVPPGTPFVIATSNKLKSPSDWPASFSATQDRKYTLSHCTYAVKIRGTGRPHAVVAYECNGKKFVFDSRQLKKLPLQINWSDKLSNRKILSYSQATSFTPLFRSTYAFYIIEK
jgi:hypothetical protein